VQSKNIERVDKLKIKDKTRVYVAGCGGMLGDALYASLIRTGAVVMATDIVCSEDWISYADVRDMALIRKSILDFGPDLIINLAALTDLEQCEREQENSWLTNALGAENLGLIANQLDVPYVYISTAGIFGGEKEFYHDFDAPNPMGIYAKSKFYGERFVCNQVPKHYVIRAGWMMGGGPKKDKKFINKIYKQICSGATELFVVEDKLGTPTYTVDFANGIIILVESGLYGLYNQVCTGSASRYEVSKEFIRLMGLADKVAITVVPSDYFREEYFAPRPASEKLINMKLDQRGLNQMRDWKICIAEYAAVFKKDFIARTAAS
jgi:dTDP-4-dehydrorhamnose reductase